MVVGIARGSRSIVAVYVALTSLMLSPLLWVDIPGLIDYPSHLARVWITAQGGSADSQNYIVHWQWIPNLAIELVLPPLLRAMALENAGRLFVALAMVMPVLGTIWLHRILFGRVGLWPLASLLFCYHAVLEWGFMNFLFGMGFALLLFPLWLQTASWRLAPRLLVFAPAATILFFMHLFAFGVYAVLVGSWEAAGWLKRSDRFPRGTIAVAGRFLQYAPAAFLFLLGAVGEGPRHTEYGGFTDKLYALAVPMGFNDLGKHGARAAVLLAVIALASRILRIAPGMGLPIATLAVMAAAMPNWVMGSWGADMRIMALFPFVLIGATQPRPLDRRIQVGICAAALMFFGVRVAGLTASWIDINSHFAEFRSAARSLPPGARLLVVTSALNGKRSVPGLPLLVSSKMVSAYFHMPMLAVVDRDVFIPYLYTSWTAIRLRRDLARPPHSQGIPLTQGDLEQALDPAERTNLAARRDTLGAAPYWMDWPKDFDFVLWLDFGSIPTALPAILSPVAAGRVFHIYRITRG